MTLAAAVAAPPPVVASGLSGALLRHAVRLIWRGGLVVVLMAAGMSALVVQQYASLFGDPSGARSLEVLAGNPAVRIMFGRPIALDDPGGFTVWRTGAPIAVLVSVWALLSTIRITRGDEEAGRWDLLLAGRLRLSRLVVVSLAAVAGVTVLSAAGVASAMIIAGADPTGAVFYGLALALIGAGAAAWGALTGQLIGDRRRAAALGAAGIVAGLLARMVADGVDWLEWLQWATPFGLLALVEPFASNRVAPLVVLLVIALALGAAVVATAWRRDLHAGVVPVRDSYRPRTVLLRSPARFALRRGLGPVLAWGLGIWLYFLVVGLLASVVISLLGENPAFAEMAARAGFGSLTTVSGYVASLFTLLGIALGLYAASRIGAGAADEEARRLTMVFAAPVSRPRWYLIEALAAVAGTVLLAAGAGLVTWAGAVAVDADLALGPTVAGAINVLPVVWLSLGAALAALGWFPQAVLAIGAIPAAGGFLLQVLAENLRWPEWVTWLSPYTHLNPVPYERVDWAGALGMVALAVALGILGLYGFARRDLRA